MPVREQALPVRVAAQHLSVLVPRSQPEVLPQLARLVPVPFPEPADSVSAQVELQSPVSEHEPQALVRQCALPEPVQKERLRSWPAWPAPERLSPPAPLRELVAPPLRLPVAQLPVRAEYPAPDPEESEGVPESKQLSVS